MSFDLISFRSWGGGESETSGDQDIQAGCSSEGGSTDKEPCGGGGRSGGLCYAYRYYFFGKKSG